MCLWLTSVISCLVLSWCASASNITPHTSYLTYKFLQIVFSFLFFTRGPTVNHWIIWSCSYSDCIDWPALTTSIRWKSQLKLNVNWVLIQHEDLGQLNEYFSSSLKCLELWDLISGRSAVYSLYSDVICKPPQSQKVLMINQRWDIVPLHYQRLNMSRLDLSKYKHKQPTNQPHQLFKSKSDSHFWDEGGFSYHWYHREH